MGSVYPNISKSGFINGVRVKFESSVENLNFKRGSPLRRTSFSLGDRQRIYKALKNSLTMADSPVASPTSQKSKRAQSVPPKGERTRKSPRPSPNTSPNASPKSNPFVINKIPPNQDESIKTMSDAFSKAMSRTITCPALTSLDFEERLKFVKAFEKYRKDGGM